MEVPITQQEVEIMKNKYFVVAIGLALLFVFLSMCNEMPSWSYWHPPFSEWAVIYGTWVVLGALWVVGVSVSVVRSAIMAGDSQQ